MSGYMPSTEDVRDAWWRDQCPPNDIDMDDIYNAGFDRWLAEHDRAVSIAAWDEGFEACDEWNGAPLDEGGSPVPKNPYRVNGGSAIK